MTLLGFELKKILSSRLNWVVLFVMFLLIGTLVTFHILDSPPSNYLKAQRGLITSEIIDNTIRENAAIASDSLNFEHGVMKSSVYKERWRPFSKFEKYISETYKVEAGIKLEAGKTVIDYLEPGMGQDFYKERLARAQEQLSIVGKEEQSIRYSETSRNMLLNMQKELKTPFLFDYHDGWQVAMGLFRLVGIMVAAAVAVCVAPILAYDYQCGMDQILYASRHGKTKLFFAKYVAGLTFLTLVYAFVMLLYSVIIFATYGFDGYSTPFQLLQWLSPYDMNMIQAYLLCVLMGYLSCCLFVAFVLLLAVGFKNMQMTMVFSWLVLLIPLFINRSIGGNRNLYESILDMMPINIMDAYHNFGVQKIYDLFGILILEPYMQMIVTVALFTVFMAAAAWVYKGHKVKGCYGG